MSQRPTASLLLLLLTLATCAGCASTRPSDMPADVPFPDDVRVSTRDGFRLFVDRSCLNTREVESLLEELSVAKARLTSYLGESLAPGDFRAYGVPREACPPDGPPRVPDSIDVVIVREGSRCHADRDGITVTKGHLWRGDATHELVHYLAGSSWRPIDEGLAVYLTEKICGADHDVPAKIRARVFLDLNLDVDLYPHVVRKEMSRRDYDTAGAFVGWLIEAYGKERFLRLYAGAVRNFETVYGMSEVGLWKRFWRYTANLDVRHDSGYYAYKARIAIK